MKVQLDLSKVCIETAAKKAYNRLLSQYFKTDGGQQKELEPVIDFLVRFLERTDFRSLRNLHGELRGGHSTPIEIEFFEDGRAVVFCDHVQLVVL